MNPYNRRRLVSRIMLGLCAASVVVVVVPLLLIIGYLIYQGISSVNLALFTQMPKPVGESGGGMANAIAGSLLLLGLASGFGMVVGVMTGIYLAEFGDNKFGFIVRFLSETLNSTPSIIIGIFAYTIIVAPMRHFSALAGGFALGVIMVPIIARTTEDMIRLVPTSLREASLALGVNKWRTIFRVVLRTASPGILTGIMLALARAAGETAPLLFTALGSRFWSLSVSEPISSLPVQIYTYAISPYEDWHRQAWAGALILIGIVVLIGLAARFLAARSSLVRGARRR
ncbi:MAG: phosphate ABC transporter permease PstA [Actinomycetota bacterium]|nr:phosphate ABC transporter permease PstA [Actinomycetota bacterium]